MAVVAGATMPLAATLLLPLVEMLLGVMLAARLVVVAGKRPHLLRDRRLWYERTVKKMRVSMLLVAN